MQLENAFLVLMINGEQKDFFTLKADSVAVIGRAIENTVSVMDDHCSRYHAKVFFENGQWHIQDLGSRNGTYIDDTLLSNAVFDLRAGDRIRVGHTLLQFGCGEPKNHALPHTKMSDDVPITTNPSGVFGVSGDMLGAPDPHRVLDTEILHQTGHTSILKADTEHGLRHDTQYRASITTRSGHGAVELCRLAYQLGKANEVDQVGKLAIEGLLDATGADGAGLWLLPYDLKSPQQASDTRLVANATLPKQKYKMISEALVQTVFERKEAILFHETSKARKSGRKGNKSEDDIGVNNTLAAPIRLQNGVIGLIHLYTIDDSKQMDEADLKYTLAVADTVGVALAHVNRQKELVANLNQVQKENTTLREMLQMNSEIIGESPPIKMVHHLIARAAEGKASLLIRGESGVGKELIARAVHFASPRKAKPFICINCAAISENLLESELFGHEKGAFTGATERKIGKFEAANTGTLFLDEIGEMSPHLQSKFLRVLEGSSFERVGGNTPVTVNVRVLAATNRDLEKEVSEGRFRHDLFFRLRVLEIVVPPLRKRGDDIIILAQHFLNKYSKETGRKYEGFDSAAMRVLMEYRWPGNIRELKNVIERAVVLGTGAYISEQDLLLSSLNTAGETGIIPVGEAHDVFEPLTMEDMEKKHIIRTLEYLQWNKSLASKQLGIERTTLDRKIKRYGLEREN